MARILQPNNHWGSVLHDDDLAQAIVDRVLERGRLLLLDGPSMRTKHLGLDDQPAPDAASTQAASPLYSPLPACRPCRRLGPAAITHWAGS